MEVRFTYKIQNSEYDTKYAKMYKDGRESDNNRKTKWESPTSAIKNVKDVILVVDESVNYKFKDDSNNEHVCVFNDIDIFRCFLENGKTINIVASKSIRAKSQKTPNRKYDITRLYFYLKDSENIVCLADNLYVDKNDVSFELKKMLE
jgi:hypothetical protein